MVTKRAKQTSRPLRAVLYARTSGEDDKNATSSIEGQLEMCREYAQGKGWQVVAELVDDGISGGDWDAPALRESMDMARAGAYDVLVARDTDRLARDTGKLLFAEKLLSSSGVETAYVIGNYENTPMGNMIKTVKASFDQLEREVIIWRLNNGRRSKVKKGGLMLNRRPAFGYRRDETDGLAIIESEAEVVRTIFRLYTGEHRMGLREVAQHLTDLKIPTPADRGHGQGGAFSRRIRPYASWSQVSVSQILSCETYAGRWVYGRNTETPIVVNVPAIVDEATFQAAQERREANKNQARRNVKYDYLLRQRVTCGTCGHSVTAAATHSKDRVYLHYRCNHAHDKNKAIQCEQRQRFRAKDVDAQVWQWIRSYLADPASLAKGLSAYQSDREAQIAPLREEIDALDKLIAGARRNLDELLDLYLSGDYTRNVLKERTANLEDTLSRQERRREELIARLNADAMSDDDIQSIFDIAAEIRTGLEDADHDFETRRRIIEMLDVTATLAIEDGEKVVYPRMRFADGESLLVSSKSISRQ